MVAWTYVISFSVASLLIALYYFQGYLLYFPSMPSKVFLEPKHYFKEEDLRNFEDVQLRATDGVKTHGWFFKQKRMKEVPTMLFLHSNAGNLSFRLPTIQHLFYGLQINVFILSYRGYGKSEGVASEKGLQLDAEAALNYLVGNPEIDPERIFVFGRSLGGAVGIHLVSTHKYPVKLLIVENTFTSIPDMIDVAMPIFKYLKFLCTNNWHSRKSIESISCPILFISGAKDQLVPPSQMQALYDAAQNSAKKEIVIFPLASHMDCFQQDGYYPTLEKFLVKHFGIWK
eukprot:TRINITY_DN2738_c0_g1_i3.p1 TRINITY_DN2738_c0_g1~~TRINITY_DN2738_c0_g1_i3.p1  ORF type:complete len:286 (-),score=48.83 TRINITY_DN2738_c0_g1_i3:79-936(-)